MVLKTLEKIKITWFFITLYNRLVLYWFFHEPKPMGINKIKYPSILGHLIVFCPLALLSFKGGPFFTPAAFTCCWSSTLSLLWGFGSCLMKEWAQNSPN
jgi:hypothetical protein